MDIRGKKYLERDGKDGWCVLVGDYEYPNVKLNESEIVIKVRNKFFLVDLDMLEILINTRIFLSEKSKYISGDFDNKRQGYHRFLMKSQDGMVSDHINHDTHDNRRQNLRNVHPTQNIANTRRFKSKRKYRGVGKGKTTKRYNASVCFHSNVFRLGSFNTEEEAAIAYDLKAIECFGIAAMTNFPIENYTIPEKCLSDSLPIKKREVNTTGEKCIICGERAKKNEILCSYHFKKKQEKENRKAIGKPIKEYAKRQKKISEICTKEGCNRKTFCRNLCEIHYREAREQNGTGYKRPPKKKEKNMCIIEGCNNWRYKHKEGLCKKHWNEKHGLNPKITGRPKINTGLCIICKKRQARSKNMCNRCYQKKDYQLKKERKNENNT